MPRLKRLVLERLMWYYRFLCELVAEKGAKTVTHVVFWTTFRSTGILMNEVNAVGSRQPNGLAVAMRFGSITR